MEQPVIFYSTLFGNQEPSSSRCSSVSRLVPQDMGDFHIERTGLLVVSEQPKRNQDPVSWAWIEIFSTLEEVPVLKHQIS